MHAALSVIGWQFALVYLEDNVVFSRSAAEHIDHVRHEVMILGDAGAALKLKKCDFFTDKIDYLGHVIFRRRLETASDKTDAIKKLKDARNVTDLKSFPRLCYVFSLFVPNFARTSFPINEKLQKDEPFHFILIVQELDAMKSL